MTPESTPPIPSEGAGRSVQDYIDETPVWADATPVRHAPITNMQWFIGGSPLPASFSKAW